MCTSLCVCTSSNPHKCTFLPAVLTWTLMWWSVCEVRCPSGISGCMRDWPQKKKTAYEIEDERWREVERGSRRSVRYSIIWSCGFYRVVTWRTSPQTVFISFTSPFPEPPASLQLRLAFPSPHLNSDKVSHCEDVTGGFLYRETFWSENGSYIAIKRIENKTTGTHGAVGKKVSIE